MITKGCMRILSGAISALAVAGSVAGTSAIAGDYPVDQLDYILHVKPGGATDVLARKVAAGLEAELGATVVVENRNGGSGAKQMAVLTRKDADGATIGSVTASHVGMFLSTGKYTIDDVEWACRLVVDPYLLVVPGDSEIDNLAELVEAAKANPGNLSVAGFGEGGSGGQIAWKIIEQAGGLDGEIKWVPYGSIKEGVIAVLGGHNDLAIGYVGLTRQHVESGALKVIGVMSDTAPSLMPSAVPFTDQGLAVDNNWQQFRGIIMPKGTPKEIQTSVCDATKAVMDADDFQTYMKDSGLNYGFQGPEEFTSFIGSQNTATQTWFKNLGIGG